MATIHLLKPNPSRTPPTSQQAGSAEIILFPGVRYERWADPAHTAVASKAKRRRRTRVKRDKLTIMA